MNMMSQYWNTKIQIYVLFYLISVIKRMFDTRWGFAPHATLLPLNWHSLFHDELGHFVRPRLFFCWITDLPTLYF